MGGGAVGGKHLLEPNFVSIQKQFYLYGKLCSCLNSPYLFSITDNGVRVSRCWRNFESYSKFKFWKITCMFEFESSLSFSWALIYLLWVFLITIWHELRLFQGFKIICSCSKRRFQFTWRHQRIIYWIQNHLRISMFDSVSRTGKEWMMLQESICMLDDADAACREMKLSRKWNTSFFGLVLHSSQHWKRIRSERTLYN